MINKINESGIFCLYSVEIPEEKPLTASTRMDKTDTEVIVDKMSPEAIKDKHHPDEGKGTAKKTGRSDMVSDSHQSNGSKNIFLKINS